MKYFLLLFGLWSYTSTAQFVVNTYSEGEDEYSINEFPVVESSVYSKAAERINDYLHYAELGKAYSLEDSNRFENVLPPEGEIWGESDFSFLVVENSSTLFSVEIMSIYTGAYSEGHARYYTFNAKTGEHLTMYDLFKPQSLGTIRDIVNAKCINDIQSYLNELDRDQEFGEEQWEMYNDCKWQFTDIEEIYPNQFLLTDSLAVFMRSRCSNHAMRALDDLWEFQQLFTYDELEEHFTENALNLINDKEWSQKGTDFPQDKVMYGKVKTYPITMILRKDEHNLISGTYWYDSQNKPIQLNGEIDLDGTFYLSETHGEVTKESIKGTFKDGVFTGEWLLTRKTPNWKVELSID